MHISILCCRLLFRPKSNNCRNATSWLGGGIAGFAYLMHLINIKPCFWLRKGRCVSHLATALHAAVQPLPPPLEKIQNSVADTFLLPSHLHNFIGNTCCWVTPPYHGPGPAAPATNYYTLLLTKITLDCSFAASSKWRRSLGSLPRLLGCWFRINIHQLISMAHK